MGLKRLHFQYTISYAYHRGAANSIRFGYDPNERPPGATVYDFDLLLRVELHRVADHRLRVSCHGEHALDVLVVPPQCLMTGRHYLEFREQLHEHLWNYEHGIETEEAVIRWD